MLHMIDIKVSELVSKLCYVMESKDNSDTLSKGSRKPYVQPN